MATRKKTSTPAKRTKPVGVPKTYKLFLGGKFPRSESGRVYAIENADGEFVAHAAQASRKDTRDAVVAARKAFAGWSGATAYNRGQVLYRVAEVLDGRRDQFVTELTTLGVAKRDAAADVAQAIDTWIHFAGFCDKYAQVLGASNPVAAPYFNFSMPEPTGVVALIASDDIEAPLTALARVLAPALVAGNTTVVVAQDTTALAAISFAEVIATSDVPAGAVNILTGSASELGPILASHMDVNAIDLAGIDDADLAKDLEALAAENLKRVLRPRDLADNDAQLNSLDAIASFTELKTVWHPIGV